MSEPDADAMDVPEQALDPLQELHELTRALRRHLEWHRHAGAYAASASTTSPAAASHHDMAPHDRYDGRHDAPDDLVGAYDEPGWPAPGPAHAPHASHASQPAQPAHSSRGAANVAANPAPGSEPLRPPEGSMSAALAAALGEEPRRKRPAPISAPVPTSTSTSTSAREPVHAAAPRPLTLAEVRTELGDCTRCKLSRTRTQIVFGSGDPRAALMFVGEAPGEQEDLSGQPFVGRAGELLEAMIKAMGWTRDTVYIANVLKCRPPGNRDPEPDEIASCRPYLARQIEAVAPRVIVALGRPAAHLLLDSNAPMRVLRGRFHHHAGIPVMPTYHPSYLLRAKDPRAQRERKGEAWQDLKHVIHELARMGISTPFPPKT